MNTTTHEPETLETLLGSRVVLSRSYALRALGGLVLESVARVGMVPALVLALGAGALLLSALRALLGI